MARPNPLGVLGPQGKAVGWYGVRCCVYFAWPTEPSLQNGSAPRDVLRFLYYWVGRPARVHPFCPGEGLSGSRWFPAEYWDRVFVAAIFNLVFDKEEPGPKVMDFFLRLLSYIHEVGYIRRVGIAWRIFLVVGGRL